MSDRDVCYATWNEGGHLKVVPNGVVGLAEKNRKRLSAAWSRFR